MSDRPAQRPRAVVRWLPLLAALPVLWHADGAAQPTTLGQPAASSPCSVAPIEMDEVRRGALARADCFLPRPGGRFLADRYRFSGKAGQQVVLAAQSALFRPYLLLIREADGGAVARAGPVGSVTRLPVGTGFIQLPADGAYLIEVTSNAPDKTGTYTVELGGPRSPYRVFGQVAEGGIGGAALAGVTLTFSRVAGTGTVPGLARSDARGSWSQSGFEPGTTYRVSASLSRYVFTPRFLEFGATGEFLFSAAYIRCDAFGIVEIQAGETTSGALERGDCLSPHLGGQSFADRYRFSGVARQRVVVVAQSEAFRPFLVLMADADDREVARAGPVGSVTRLPVERGFFELPADGAYVIEVASNAADKTGAYTLTLGDMTSPYRVYGLVTEGGVRGRGLGGVTLTFSRAAGSGVVPAPVRTDADGSWSQQGFVPGVVYRVTASLAGYAFTPRSPEFTATRELLIAGTRSECDTLAVIPIRVGETKTGALEETDCLLPQPGGQSFVDQYRFRAVAGQQVVVVAQRSPFRPFLVLMRDADDQELARAGPVGAVARLPVGAGSFEVPADGTYVIEVTSSAVNETGSYTLTLGAPCGDRAVGLGEGCDDASPCTADSCDPAGVCVHMPTAGPCEDPDVCTTGDTCVDGRCVGGPPRECNDGNPCTDDTCVSMTGCVYTNNTARCDDGNACTTVDACTDGRCTGSQPLDCRDGNACTDDACEPATGCVHSDNTPRCDDGNLCTDDACDPATGCVHSNNSAPCDDGDACTTADTCAEGRCVGGPAPDCDDGNVCTDDVCAPATGCVHTNNVVPCDDGDACTTADTCREGGCVGGAAPDCDDGDVCTDDSCVAPTGCVHTNNAAPCDDGDACTTKDTCRRGRCRGGPAPDCDDGDVCTDDTCVAATGCVHTNNVAPCDDGDACTTADTCAEGRCVGGPPPHCDDGNVCTDDTCAAAAGCVNAPNAASCDDGDACTTKDTCAQGQCIGGPAPNCDDGDVCTDDTCAPATGCVHTNNVAACDDGNACTTADTCAEGGCVGGPAPDCDDGNVCTDDTCAAATGCVYTNNVATCDDGNACTMADTCREGRCVGGPAPDCDDGNVCTDDTCAPATGCVHTNNVAPCDDGDPCTTNDTCRRGRCRGGPAPDCDDGDVCTDDTCASATGCVHTNNVAACDDGDACTTADTCAEGRCVGGSAPDCDDGDVCTDDTCAPATGCVHTPNAAPCDDGDACTTGDRCSGGVCVGGSPPHCDDGNVCTDDACDAAAGCVNTPNAAPCDDGDACTTADTCAEGRCVGGSAPDCDDGDVCTDDTCAPATGCVHTNNVASCDDGNACTMADTCRDGQCRGGPAPNCDDGDVCTDDACAPATGCVHTNNVASCDDGNACTTADTCSEGRCVGGPAPDCDDGDVCTDDRCVPARGCVHTRNAAPCDDDNACTTTDTCSKGRCVGGPSVDCDDGDPCTDDGCDPAAGCVHTNNTAPCDDQDACTVDDACTDGRCVGRPPPGCDDGDVCTDDTCAPDIGCVHRNNTAPCDDGNACTTEDACAGGVCVGGPPTNCDDGNICTDDACDAVSGCIHINNNMSCDDGNACTTADMCAEGRCVGGPATVCDDGDICTDDACDRAAGCVHRNNRVQCDDGNACTAGDACAEGRCVGGPRPVCDDGNVCTDDICEAATGCVHANNAAPCDDRDACTTGDRCADGQCIGGVPLECDDGNPCTDDACDAARGCVYTGNSAPCDDGNACTAGDACADGRCAGGPPLRCDDGNRCTDDACDAARGCVHTNNTAPCDDGNACTTGDACARGRCVGGPPVRCDDADVCTDDGCDPTRGCVHSSNTAACDDGNACTTGDTCAGGRCVGGPPPVCDDGNACTDDGCSADSGCVHSNNVAACDDGDACTTGDACADGRCVGGKPQACDDGNVCTNDRCDGGRGCVYRNNAAACDDGNACTTGDTCAGGRCVGGPPPNCDDGNVCTNDGCDGVSGCVYNNNAVPCDDGSACTTDDTCAEGQCRSGPSRDCDDGNVCTDDGCDPASGCTHILDTNCAMACGDLAVAPCSVTVSSSERRFSDLQAAIDAAVDGATVTVAGVCPGPIKVSWRHGLTIQGVPPSPSGCPADGLAPNQLHSTLKGGGKVLVVRKSEHIAIRFLNIVDGATQGLQFSEVDASRAECNCMARNGTTGLSVVAGRGNELDRNLIMLNARLGIQLRDATGNTVVRNTIRDNRDAGVLLKDAHQNTLRSNAIEGNAADGVALDYSDRNVLRENAIHGNAGDGIDLETADRNELMGNHVRRNGDNPNRDSGIELEESGKNIVGDNTIEENADGLVNMIRCQSGSRRNRGSNVPQECS